MQATDVFISFFIIVFLSFMYFGFLGLYRYIRSKKVSVPGPIFGTGCVQEDPEVAATKKRVRKAFEDQKQDLDARAMKAHDPSCPDTWDCIKDPCFVWEPDKIVSKPVIEKRKTDAQRREEERDFRSKKLDKPFKRRRTKEKE